MQTASQGLILISEKAARGPFNFAEVNQGDGTNLMVQANQWGG